MKIELGKTLVKILWEDAWSDPGYFSLKQIAEEEPYLIETVGWVIRNDKTGISTAREKFADGRFRTIQHIGRPMIRKVEILRAS